MVIIYIYIFVKIVYKWHFIYLKKSWNGGTSRNCAPDTSVHKQPCKYRFSKFTFKMVSFIIKHLLSNIKLTRLLFFVLFELLLYYNFRMRERSFFQQKLWRRSFVLLVTRRWNRWILFSVCYCTMYIHNCNNYVVVHVIQ